LYLLKYDSVYGTFPRALSLDKGMLEVNGKQIRCFSEPEPSLLPWNELKVDVVLECTGKFTGHTAAHKHIEAGAKKVILSTTGDEQTPLMIFGYNHQTLDRNSWILSPGGCMTNCSAPVLDVLSSRAEIHSVHINFLHSYTSRQELIDAPNQQFRRGRAAAESIIPVEIDQAVTLERLFPELKGKLATLSTRVPVANGALADISVVLNKSISTKEWNELFKAAAVGKYKGVLDCSYDPVVSIDMRGNNHSCIVDTTLTSVVGNHLKLMVWFDNETGFTSRVIDWLEYIG
ncbi:MAG TPA: type I glyceraldehyde-3-phosphate dehydrogenase, partial [Parasegetibacter sp.]